MKYSYQIEGDRKAYLRLTLDRQVSTRSIYRSEWSLERATPFEKELLDAIANTNGVIKGCVNTSTSPGFIHLDGNRIEVEIIPLNDVAELVNQIVKKIQRRIARGENRQRVSLKAIQEKFDRLNQLAA